MIAWRQLRQPATIVLAMEPPWRLSLDAATDTLKLEIDVLVSSLYGMPTFTRNQAWIDLGRPHRFTRKHEFFTFRGIRIDKHAEQLNTFTIHLSGEHYSRYAINWPAQIGYGWKMGDGANGIFKRTCEAPNDEEETKKPIVQMTDDELAKKLFGERAKSLPA